MLVLDFSCLKEDFENWLDENFYEYKDSILSDDLEILVDTKNPFSQKLSIIEDENREFKLFNILNYSS
ncbi:hypothetical protein IKN40_06245 [bacterium]|jgi:hypothetical protein|nr:hypothetical protein [bacterium]